MRATGFVILVVGFAAFASAVVPGFVRFLHGNKIYLVVTATIGLNALVGVIQMLVGLSELGLGVLMGAMGVLWLSAAIHDVLLAEAAHVPRPGPPRQRPPSAWRHRRMTPRTGEGRLMVEVSQRELYGDFVWCFVSNLALVAAWAL